MMWHSFREALTMARSRLTTRTGRSAGSTSTGQRTPPRPTAQPSTAGPWAVGFSQAMTRMNATVAEPSWAIPWPDAPSADTLPEPGSRDSAREWADCLLSIANVLQDESNSEPFRYAVGRVMMASIELRRWADEDA